ncbi:MULTISPECIES: GGDEF domain-containing protein [Desulfosediminicola]|uniref:GGDEF domain-containing protein n=1 Tax=Desulfosediminicola TaxID=2886823 RepID=UPI0010AB6C23|nr:GGDEF domain-containing protein [Desulfosediminicola ganghwensis]
MDSTRALILECRSSSPDDDTFISRVNGLVAQYGNSVYPALFETLTTLDLSQATARDYWQLIVAHRRHLMDALGREVDLLTATSDFLQTSTKLLNDPRLVDVSTYENVVTDSIHDKLTGLYNRPYFDETYEQQVSLAKRYDTELAVLFLDVDDFKEVNDSFGHLAGDFALQKVAKIIQDEKRDSDIASRYGGEEFVLLMPHTQSDSASILAERIRKKIELTEFEFDGKHFSLTISGGLASYPTDATDPRDLLTMADKAVYRAKGAGKNNISLFKQDKRKYLRVGMEREVLLKSFDFVNEPYTTFSSKNIGIGGMLLSGSTPLPVGSIQKMSVPVNGGEPLMLIGKVVRISEPHPSLFEIGMSFSLKEMTKLANSEIAIFLRKNSVEEVPKTLEPAYS